MRIKHFLIILFGVLVFTSCEGPKYSEREQLLFINPYFGYDVEVDSLETLGDLVVYLDEIYCEIKLADKWPVLYFDVERGEVVSPIYTGKRNILALGIEPSPCPEVMFEYDYSRILEVVKDGYNLEVEEQRIEPDSLTKYVSMQYLNYGKNSMFSPSPQNNGIWLITNKDDKLSNLNDYIRQLIDGYVIMANQYALLTYEESLEDISDEEFAQLKIILSFHLSFKYSDVPPQIKLGF